MPIFFCRIHILSATLLICSQAEKTRDIMSLMSVFTRWCPFSHGWVQLICHVLLTHYKTYIGGRSYSLTTKQTICWNSVGFLDLHKQTWVASTDMNLLSFIVPWWNIKRCLQFRRNSNLLLFFYFSVMIQSGEFLASVWQEEENFDYSVFAVLGKSCYSST